jgi:hypothetical protein
LGEAGLWSGYSPNHRNASSSGVFALSTIGNSPPTGSSFVEGRERFELLVGAAVLGNNLIAFFETKHS